MGAVSTIWAPLHRALARSSNLANAGFPLNAAPNIDFLGSGIQDHRLPYNARGSSANQPGIIGWYGEAAPIVANIVPSAAATGNIAAAANPASGTPMTLRAASGAGIIKLSTAAPAVFPTPGVSVSAGVAIESLPTFHAFGSGGNFTTGFYNRSTVVGRAVSVTGVGSGSGGAILVSGYDCYGFAMSESITLAAGANTVNGKKAFKVITSVVPQFTDSHTVACGTADIFGFGLLASFAGDVQINWNSTWITASTGFVAADTTSPATTTTGDVRGTYAVQDASDGTKRLLMRVSPTLGSILTNPTTGLFGVPQV